MKINKQSDLRRYQIIDRITSVSQSILVQKELIRNKKVSKQDRNTAISVLKSNLTDSIKELKNLLA